MINEIGGFVSYLEEIGRADPSKTTSLPAEGEGPRREARRSLEGCLRAELRPDGLGPLTEKSPDFLRLSFSIAVLEVVHGDREAGCGLVRLLSVGLDVLA